MDHNEWSREKGELSQYNKAKRPYYSIDSNGKVDIGNDFGDPNKIGLDKGGVLNFIKEYLSQVDKHQIRQEQRQELIKLLSE